MPKQRPKVQVFWAGGPPENIEEVRYSYAYCQRRTKELLGEAFDLHWSSLEPQAPCSAFADCDASHLLFVTDPQCVVGEEAVRSMIAAADLYAGIIGPTYAACDKPYQQASLPAPYLNLTGFRELSALLARDQRTLAVRSLHPACMLTRREVLAGCCGPVVRLAAYEGASHFVAKGALAHLFHHYADFDRDDLIELLPAEVRRVLDVGCGRGGYGRSLRRLRPEVVAVGVEPNREMAIQAEKWYEKVHLGELETLDLAERFDAINCGDVLEHLKNPWDSLCKMRARLRQGGVLVASVPNVGHWTVVQDLVAGRFEYMPAGITCITHLRWFTERSLRELIESAGFDFELMQHQSVPPTPAGEAFIQHQIATRVTVDEASLRCNEFVIRARLRR